MLETFLHYVIIGVPIALLTSASVYLIEKLVTGIHHAIRDRHARQYRSPRR